MTTGDAFSAESLPLGEQEWFRLTTLAVSILLAWEAGEITEGQAMAALGMDRQKIREWKQALIAAGKRHVEGE